MTRGHFITFEGGEGAGKSTQARMLADRLRKRGTEVITTREPGGTAGAEAVRALLLDGVPGDDGDNWNPRAEALLFAAARSDHVHRVIKPALSRGAWVICDRYIDSSRAYQGGGSGLSDDQIMHLHMIGTEGLLPDRTLLIEVNSHVAMQRLAERDAGRSDRIGGRSVDYHARVATAFRDLATREPRRFALVDGNDSPQTTHQRVLDALRGILT